MIKSLDIQKLHDRLEDVEKLNDAFKRIQITDKDRQLSEALDEWVKRERHVLCNMKGE